MTQAAASAPGKLLLTGEYAVLDGAPALVAAVDRRVSVRVATTDDGQGRLTARPLGLVDAPTALVGDRLECPGRGDVDLGVTGRFLPRALAALGRRPGEAASLTVAIDSRELFDRAGARSVKLGLGSSAAVCAALAAALQAVFPPPGAAPGRDRLARWLPAYRDALGGHASGADLAAALQGGLIAYADDGGAPAAQALAWPAGLFWQPVWVGRPARTTDFVARFRRWQREEPGDAAARLAELDLLARRAAEAVGSARELAAAAADYGAGVRALGEAMDCPVETPMHRRLADAAARLMTNYKTCGAGGGDFGVALDTDRDRLAAFAAEAAGLGAVPVNLKLGSRGAEVAHPERPGTGD